MAMQGQLVDCNKVFNVPLKNVRKQQNYRGNFVVLSPGVAVNSCLFLLSVICISFFSFLQGCGLGQVEENSVIRSDQALKNNLPKFHN